MIHPILAVFAVGGLIYSHSPICPADYSLASASMLWGYALASLVVSLAGLGDFPGVRSRRHVRGPLAIADLPGCKDEKSPSSAYLKILHSRVTGVDGKAHLRRHWGPSGRYAHSRVTGVSGIAVIALA